MADGGRRAYDWRPWLRRGEAGAPEGAGPRLWRGRRIRSASLTGLFVLACVYTLSIARSLLLPLAVGLIFYFLLRPPVRALRRVRVPEPLGAALVLLALVTVVGGGLYALSFPAAAWMARAPESLLRVESRLRPIARRVQRLTRTAEEMQKITEVTGPAATRVQLNEPSFGALFVGGMSSFLTGAVVALSLAYFLLAEGDALVGRVVRVLPRLKDRKRAVAIACEMEQQISGYLFFSTVLNALFGVFIGLLMWVLHMPNPALWGFVAAVTKFIPYLGGLICTVVLALASVVTFDQLWWALLVPSVFLVIDTIHGNVVMPMLLGRRFTLDPAALFVGLFFWWFVWGTTGALLAVPIMSALQIFCAHVDGLQEIGAFLGGANAERTGPEGEKVSTSPGA